MTNKKVPLNQTLDYVKLFPVEVIDDSVLDSDDEGTIVTGGSVKFRKNIVGKPPKLLLEILWQDGVVDPHIGANGMTLEALVDAVIARLQAFQKTRFACDENEEALDFLIKANKALTARRNKRFKRGVLNKHVV
jgi:hypothetical protein